MHIHTTDQDELELGFGDYTCNWGTHFAGLYETEEEKDRIICVPVKMGGGTPTREQGCSRYTPFRHFLDLYLGPVPGPNYWA